MPVNTFHVQQPLALAVEAGQTRGATGHVPQSIRRTEGTGWARVGLGRSLRAVGPCNHMEPGTVLATHFGWSF